MSVPIVGVAQEQNSSEVEPTPMILETMIVSATRRQETQSTVPLSITALSAQDIKEAEINDVFGLEAEVPNFSVTTAFGGDSAAALNVRGLLGGAVQIVSKKPEIGGESDGYVELGTGNFGLIEGSAASSFQLSDTFAVRLAASTSQRDGYTNSLRVDDTFNPAAGQFGYIDGVSPVLENIDTNDRDNTAFRVSALWQPSYETRVNLSYYRSENDTNGVLLTSRTGDLGAANLAVGDVRTFGRGASSLTANDFYSGLTNISPDGDDELEIATVSLEHEFSDQLAFKLIASHTKVELFEFNDTDGLVASSINGVIAPSTFSLAALREQDADQSTLELQLSGENNAGTINWIAGLYYFEEESIDNRAEVIGSPFLETTPAAFLPPELQPFAGGIPTTSIDVVAENDSASVFGSVTWSLNEAFKLRFGGRYTEDTKGFLGSSVLRGGQIPAGLELCIFDNVPTAVRACSFQNDADFENFTWDISADYAFSDSTFGYAKAGSGYRTGGISINANSRETAQPFDEDEVISYEIGLKTSIADQAQINASVFYVDFTDVQQNILSSDSAACFQTPGSATGVIITCNLGDASSSGFEIDGAWQITKNFAISANLGYVDFEFDDSSLVRTQTPDYAYSISGIYNSSIANLPVRAIVSYQESDDVTLSSDSAIPADLRTLEGYSLLNARISLQLTDNLEFALWGRNLAEEEYFEFSVANTNAFAIFSAGLPGAPRTYGADLSYKF